jgi:hypothetical protein
MNMLRVAPSQAVTIDRDRRRPGRRRFDLVRNRVTVSDRTSIDVTGRSF